MADKLIDRIKNVWAPTVRDLPPKNSERNLRNYISPVQLQRLRHDVAMWRECIQEAELAYFPHRVKMQRMYLDTVFNGHTYACIKRRKQLTMLREWEFKNKEGVESEQNEELLNKKWFSDLIEYILDSRFFGYSLIALGDITDGNFNDLSIVRRANVSPDRLVVNHLVYALDGAEFMQEPYSDWCVYVPTTTENGISICGYGLLYQVALYEIICRNLLGANADAAELFGMPIRVGKTNKTEEHERGTFANALADMGSQGWILLDEFGESIELVESGGNGQGFKIYPDLEQRCEKKISKIILGHADALDSTSGKLGAGQGEDSPVAQALMDTRTEDGAFVEDVINNTVIPKLIKLGFKLDANYKFCFSNNEEKEHEEIEQRDNSKVYADIASTMKTAGLKMDAKYFTEMTGVVLVEGDENTDSASQAELRGSVGGVTGIIQLQQSVANGLTSKEAAVATLKYVYGFDDKKATEIVGEAKVVPPTPPKLITDKVKNKLANLYK